MIEISAKDRRIILDTLQAEWHHIGEVIEDREKRIVALCKSASLNAKEIMEAVEDQQRTIAFLKGRRSGLVTAKGIVERL